MVSSVQLTTAFSSVSSCTPTERQTTSNESRGKMKQQQRQMEIAQETSSPRYYNKEENQHKLRRSRKSASTKPILTKSCLLVIILQLCSDCRGDFEPPFINPVTFRVGNNNWRVHEDEAIGTKITDIRMNRESGPINITYTIEPEDIAEHFRIETRPGGYGNIFLQKSFQGQKGKDYIVSVVGTVADSSRRTRVEVLLRIEGSSSLPEERTPISPKLTHPLLPPPGAITPPPPPDVGDNNFPVNPPATRPTPTSSSKAPSTSSGSGNETTTGTSDSTTARETTSQDISTVFQPHFPPSNGSDSSQPPSAPGNAYSPSYNVSLNDPHLTKPTVDHDDDRRYPEVPDNEIGKSAAANSAKGDASNKNAGLGIPQQKETRDGNMALVTTIPIIAILGIIAITAATLYLVNKRNKMKKRPVKEIRKESAVTINSNTTMSGEAEPPTALQHWPGKRAQSNRYESWAPDAVPIQARDRWEFPRHHLQIGGILGEGCFGQVWRCEALNIDGKEGTTTVAVKTLKESAGERERQDLLSELTVMKMLDPHPNVVRLLGCCTDKDPIFVIMEYVALGKLQTYLRSSRASHYYGNLHGDSTSLSSKDLTSFAYQVARGMEYLASKGIIHRDLAARNILIDKERVCKVADFGFARDIVDNHVYERKSDGRLPIRWMAPEALYDNLFTTKTDVWSFGVLMWEIVTLGSTPYPGMAAAEVMRKVRDGHRLEKPEHCRRELYNIMFYCWAHNPVDRPSFSDLVNFLSHLLFSETDYIELDRFPDHDYYNMASLSGEKL